MFPGPLLILESLKYSSLPVLHPSIPYPTPSQFLGVLMPLCALPCSPSAVTCTNPIESSPCPSDFCLLKILSLEPTTPLYYPPSLSDIIAKLLSAVLGTKTKTSLMLSCHWTAFWDFFHFLYFSSCCTFGCVLQFSFLRNHMHKMGWDHIESLPGELLAVDNYWKWKNFFFEGGAPGRFPILQQWPCTHAQWAELTGRSGFSFVFRDGLAVAQMNFDLSVLFLQSPMSHQAWLAKLHQAWLAKLLHRFSYIFL